MGAFLFEILPCTLPLPPLLSFSPPSPLPSFFLLPLLHSSPPFICAPYPSSPHLCYPLPPPSSSFSSSCLLFFFSNSPRFSEKVSYVLEETCFKPYPISNNISCTSHVPQRAENLMVGKAAFPSSIGTFPHIQRTRLLICMRPGDVAKMF